MLRREQRRTDPANPKEPFALAEASFLGMREDWGEDFDSRFPCNERTAQRWEDGELAEKEAFRSPETSASFWWERLARPGSLLSSIGPILDSRSGGFEKWLDGRLGLCEAMLGNACLETERRGVVGSTRARGCKTSLDSWFGFRLCLCSLEDTG